MLFICPQCEPGPIWYAGPVKSRICGACLAANDNDADLQRRRYEQRRARNDFNPYDLNDVAEMMKDWKFR